MLRLIHPSQPKLHRRYIPSTACLIMNSQKRLLLNYTHRNVSDIHEGLRRERLKLDLVDTGDVCCKRVNNSFEGGRSHLLVVSTEGGGINEYKLAT